MNSITLTGRLVADVVANTGRSGQSYAPFTLAVPRGADEHGDADFFECIAFGKTADSLQRNTRKGCKLLVSGFLRIAKWTTDSGEERSKPQVTAGYVEIITWPNREKLDQEREEIREQIHASMAPPDPFGE